MQRLNIERLYKNNNKKEEFKTYSVIDGNEYLSYKIEIDKEKLRNLKEEFVSKYSDYETVIKENVRVDGIRGIKDTFKGGNIEILDSVSVNLESDFNGVNMESHPYYGIVKSCGGPVYSDFIVDIKRHPGIETIISKFILNDRFDLDSLYKYICNITNNDVIDVIFPTTNEPVRIKSFTSTNLVMTSQKEKLLNNEELKIIIDSIFDCFTIVDVEVKQLVDNELMIKSSITVDELTKIKEDLEIAKKNGQIVNSKIMNNLFIHNTFVKEKTIKNNIY